jgi:hypothetical protein
MKFRRISAWLAGAALAVAAGAAQAATNTCSSVPTVAGSATAVVTALSASCAWSTTQLAVGNLANVAAGTILGNPTGSSAAPEATSAPVLGVASTTAGTLGLYSSSTADAVTIQNVGATSAYNFNLPDTAGTSGQVLESGGGGSAAMTWASALTAQQTVNSETSSSTTAVSSAADYQVFDNAGASGAVTLTLPSSPNKGDNWSFCVMAAETFEIAANTGQSFNLGGVTGASAGNIQSSTIGSCASIRFETTTSIMVAASTGPWEVN